MSEDRPCHCGSALCNAETYHPSSDFQDGQCLPDDVLGVIASFQKIYGQDLSSANLNMASRTLREETLSTLWGTVSVPRLENPLEHPLEGLHSQGTYQAFLRRLMNAQGAKHIRYVA